MRKLFVMLFALVLMSNSDCEGGSFETDEQVYLVVDKGSGMSDTIPQSV